MVPNLKELNLCGVESAFLDSTWVREQLTDKHLKLSTTVQDMVKNYSR